MALHYVVYSDEDLLSSGSLVLAGSQNTLYSSGSLPLDLLRGASAQGQAIVSGAGPSYIAGWGTVSSGAALDPNTPQPVGLSGVVGTSGSSSHGDHVHQGVTSVNAQGYGYASGNIEIIPGTGISLSQSSGSMTITGSSGSNPSVKIGLSPVNGSLSTFLRSDASPALDQSIVPTWTGLHTFNPGAAGDLDAIVLDVDNPISSTRTSQHIRFRSWSGTGPYVAQDWKLFSPPSVAGKSAFELAYSDNGAAYVVELKFDPGSGYTTIGGGLILGGGAPASAGKFPRSNGSGYVDSTLTLPNAATLGDLPYASATNAVTMLPGNTTVVQKFLSQTGTGSVSAAPSWQPIPVAGLATFFFIDTASSIGGAYKQAVSSGNYTPATKASLTTAGANTNTVVGIFATNAGFPGLSFIPDGTFHLHIHALYGGGTATLTLAAHIYQRDVGGTETLLLTSEDTAALTTSELEFDVSAVLTQPVALATTDRIVVKWFVSAASAARDVTIYYDGTGVNETFSRIELPTAAIDSSTFVPYTGATTALDMGAHAITATSLNLSAASNQLVMQSAGVTGTLTWTPTSSNKTITLPNLTGTVALGSGILTNTTGNDSSIANHTHSITSGSNPGISSVLLETSTSGSLQLQGLTLNQSLVFGNGATGTLAWSPTATRTITLPDSTGTAALGTGTSTYLGYWSGTNTLTGSAGLSWTNAANTLNISGPASTGGQTPNLYLKFTSDTDAAFSYLAYSHDNVALVWDAWFNGSAWVSSNVTSNVALYKSSGNIYFGFNSGTAKGSTFASFTPKVYFTPVGDILDSGKLMVGSTSVPTCQLQVQPVSDIVQMKVTGYSTQTNNIIEARKSTTALLFAVDNTGTIKTAAGATWDLGALTTGTTAVLDATKYVTTTIGGVTVKLAVIQ